MPPQTTLRPQCHRYPVHITATKKRSSVPAARATVPTCRRLIRRARDESGAALRSPMRGRGLSSLDRRINNPGVGFPWSGATLMPDPASVVRLGRPRAAIPLALMQARGPPKHGPGVGRAPCVRWSSHAPGHRPGQESTGGGTSSVSFLFPSRPKRDGSVACLCEIGASPCAPLAAQAKTPF